MPWDPQIVDSEILAIHAAILPTNEVLLFGGDEHSSAQHAAGDIDNTRTHAVGADHVDPMSSPTTDVFCAGHAFLADGRLLVAGGTEAWVGDVEYHDHALGFPGHRECWVYEPRARTWQAVASMVHEPGNPGQGGGRWYPTLVTLANGEVVAMFGHPSSTDSRHRNNNFERYSAGADAWAALPSIAEAEAISYTSNALNYPRVFLLRDGMLFFATPVSGCRIYDPFGGAWVGGTLPAPSEGLYHEWYGSAVLLPLLPADGYAARVMHVGATDPRVMNVHAASPQWAEAGTRQGAAADRVRENVVAVLLPTGQVFLSGGDETVSPETPVLEPEIYTPDIDWSSGTYGSGDGTWQSKEPATIPRNYHSTALLLPNGRVWTAGSSINANQGPPSTTGRLQIEIYRPDYDGQPNRPQIVSAPASIGYGETFTIATPQAQTIERVALIRAGSVTHGFDADQRYVGLEFTAPDAGTLRCAAPPHGAIAPPGNYMLWIVDTSDRPCESARFVRVSGQRCLVITDRSTFSSFEVEALLPPNVPAGPAAFPRALYVIFDGFLPHELGTPIVAPTPDVRFDGPDGPAAGGDVTVHLRDTLFEDPAQPPDAAQRITFVYDVRFASAAPFATFAETRVLNVRFAHGSHVCDATLDLIKQPNPYMLDGPTHWLSTDVRVFQIRPGQTRAGVTHGSGAGAPQQFVQDLVTAFRGQPNDEFHPFHDITTDQTASQLELSREVNGQRVYNYAVAKVRYRAATVPASDVRVFFRAFNTVGPALEFNTATTYPRSTAGPDSTPLLGTRGGELVSIPFFAAARVDSGSQSLTTQTDPLNRQTLQPAGAQEFAGYVGCWLDVNQTEPQFPAGPSGTGPYTDRLSIQQLMRGRHQCLVAEVFFEPDPIHTGDTPGSSDNLSQRNLAIVESANPGEPATRTVHHTFDVRASEAGVVSDQPGVALPVHHRAAVAAFESRLGGPDELMIVWEDVPPGTQATIYWPGIDAEEVVRAAGRRGSAPRLEAADPETLRVRVDGDVTFVPIPGQRAKPIAGLLSIELPEGVRRKQVFTVTAHQWSGVSRRILGAFQLTIPVGDAADIVERDRRDLSVLRHVHEAIPADDRWRPVFDRYLGGLADRVRAFSGDPDSVWPSPDGDGGRPGEDGAGLPGAEGGKLRELLCRVVPCLAAAWAIVTAVLSVLTRTRRRSRALRRALEVSAAMAGAHALLALLMRCLGLCRDCGGPRAQKPPRREPVPWAAPPRVAAPPRERPAPVAPPKRVSPVPPEERPPAIGPRSEGGDERGAEKRAPGGKPGADDGPEAKGDGKRPRPRRRPQSPKEGEATAD